MFCVTYVLMKFFTVNILKNKRYFIIFYIKINGLFIVNIDMECSDEETIRVKEQAILDLGSLYFKTKKALGLCFEFLLNYNMSVIIILNVELFVTIL